jgi:hypothetical protein
MPVTPSKVYGAWRVSPGRPGSDGFVRLYEVTLPKFFGVLQQTIFMLRAIIYLPDFQVSTPYRVLHTVEA